jgi:hypothetical protein
MYSWIATPKRARNDGALKLKSSISNPVIASPFGRGNPEFTNKQNQINSYKFSLCKYSGISVFQPNLAMIFFCNASADSMLP